MWQSQVCILCARKMKKAVAVLVSLLASLMSAYQLNCLLLFLNPSVYHRIVKQVSQTITFSRQNFSSKGKVCEKRRQGRYWVRQGRTRVWWDNFVNEVVVPEEWKENFRMCRGWATSTHSEANYKINVRLPVEVELLSCFFSVPQCIGAINCTHIDIKAPTNNPTDYVNRKSQFFLNVHACCDYTRCCHKMYMMQGYSPTHGCVTCWKTGKSHLVQDISLMMKTRYQCSYWRSSISRPTVRGGTGDTSPGPHMAFIFMTFTFLSRIFTFLVSVDKHFDVRRTP